MKIIRKLVVFILMIVASYTFINTSLGNKSDKTEIILAHGQAGGSEIADTIEEVARYKDNEKNGLDIKIYPSSSLGNEQETVELVKSGAIDMAKISANTLGQFDRDYNIFSLPYLFKSKDHYYNALKNSQEVKKLFSSTEDKGYIAIGYYLNGSRNFYLVEDKVCDSPEVLSGKKIRSMSNTTAMTTIELMGGSPVPMASSETYTSLQQGIVDGAENTELALTVDAHEDVVKSYTYTEHQYIPDIYIISTKTWNALSKDQKKTLVNAISNANDKFVKVYDTMMEEAIEEAKEHGVSVYYNIDKTEFIESVKPLHEEFLKGNENGRKLYNDIQNYEVKQ